jgi:capsular polysaccharide biosynthesis protein
MNRGFEVIEPDRLGFADQVALLGEAQVVVASTGAACANLVFCRGGTKAAVLMAKHPHMLYRYWATMVGPLGIEVSCVLGKTEATPGLGVHSNFTVESEDVIAFLEHVGLQ